MKQQPELTIKVPRSRWLRGNEPLSNGYLAAKDTCGDYHLCIMGFVGQALGISPADMDKLEFLERVRGLREDGYYEKELTQLLRRHLVELSSCEGFYESTPQAVLAMTANDDHSMSDADREAYLQDMFLNTFNIRLEFTD